MKTIFLAAIVPSALPHCESPERSFSSSIYSPAPGLGVTGETFCPDSTVTGDRMAIRQLQAIVLGIPWLFLTFRLLFIYGSNFGLPNEFQRLLSRTGRTSPLPD